MYGFSPLHIIILLCWRTLFFFYSHDFWISHHLQNKMVLSVKKHSSVLETVIQTIFFHVELLLALNIFSNNKKKKKKLKLHEQICFILYYKRALYSAKLSYDVCYHLTIIISTVGIGYIILVHGLSNRSTIIRCLYRVILYILPYHCSIH